jgi:hypothetical protein
MKYIIYIKNPFILFAILNVIYAFYIPLNILPGAPHDDTLFYDLGYKIAHFRWLGDFTPVSHIKGPVYPFFISISILLHIPLRILEALFIIFTSLYFVTFLSKFSINKNLLIITYIVLIFYPYQYGLIDFRILRDMIYPQICLMVFTTLGNIYYSIKLKQELSKVDIILFGVFLFLYQNTREESIWIIPSLLLTLLIIGALLKNNIRLLVKSLLFSALIYFSFTCSLSVLNYVKYGSVVNNVFKNSDFQMGYGSLYRIKRDRLLLESVNKEDFDQLFSVSPTLLKLKTYIESDQYIGWVGTACFAHESQGKIIQNDTSCPKNMPAAFLLFALMDGMYSIGIRSPGQMSEFMRNIADEINLACNANKIVCDQPTISNMPPQLINFSIDFSDLWAKIKQSIEIIMFYQPPTIKSILSSADNDGAEKIRKKLHAFFFQTKEVKLNIEDFDGGKINRTAKNSGWVDGIVQRSYGFDLMGWAYDGKNKFDKVVVISDDKQICSTKPNIKRRDINPESPEFIGFQCNVNYLVTTDPIKLEIYGYLANKDNYHKIEIIDFVEATLSNKYNELCYKKYNIDVRNAENNGVITGYDHWKNHGTAEKRNCSALQIKSKYYLDKQKDNTIIKNNAYEWLANSYNLVISNFWFLIPIAGILMLFIREGALAVVWVILTSLVLARIVLISLLDVVGMAPVSGMYLASGVYFYFILFLMSVIFIINYVLEKKKT